MLYEDEDPPEGKLFVYAIVAFLLLCVVLVIIWFTSACVISL